MTVMQHERGALGGFSKDMVEDEEDVLSRLRHLHRTLQECHWRVQLVDHALCAQGDKDFLDHQNDTENDHSFQNQAGKDCNHQNQAGQKYSFQDETGDHSLHNKAGEDHSFQNEAQKDQYLKDAVKKPQDHPEEENNHQNELKEEFESESVFWEDQYHEKIPEEKHFQQKVTIEDEKLTRHAEGDLPNLCHNSRETFPYQSMQDSSLQNFDMIDRSKFTCPKTKHLISNETTGENKPPNNIYSTCSLDCTGSHKKQRPRYLLRQNSIDYDDLMPADNIDMLSATGVSSHTSGDPSLNETSPGPCIMTDVISHQFSLDAKCSEKILRQERMENCHYLGKVRYRPDHKQECSENNLIFKGGIDISGKRRTSDASHEQQDEGKNKDIQSASGKASSLHHSPEVTKRVDVVWEALENLQSHFLALHSSLIDYSSNCLNQELTKSLDNTASVESKKVTELGELCEEQHTTYEAHAGMLHHTSREITQTHQFFGEQFRTQLPTRRPPHLVCYKLLENQSSSSAPNQKPANQAVSGDNTMHRGTFLQWWRDGCLCIGTVLLLLLVLLFLASCLLLVLPVVSVSVRTAGGLPAF